MEKASPLFRQEAINSRIHRSLGSFRINVPMNYRIAGFGALIIITLLVSFILFAEVTEKTFLRGYLDSQQGIVTIESDHHGLIEQLAVSEGKCVKKGDLLYVITNPNTHHTDQQAAILKQRLRNLKRTYQLKENHHQALQKLYRQHYISLTNLNESESLLLEIRNKLKGLEYELLSVKQNQYHLIKAPIDGIVTNIFYHPGQSIQPSKPLVHIIPQHAGLIAKLYVPAREIGFVKLGQTIYLKYDAYPSQRFGLYKATIQEINKTILTDDKEDKPVQIGEPYYKLEAKLTLPYVKVYGKKALLSHGMTLTAVIRGEKKKIWRWILDPIYSFRDDI